MSADVDCLNEPFRTQVRKWLDEGAGAFWPSSTCRTRAEQIELRRKHCGPTQYDIYERPAKECNPSTARPGTSQHEKGAAIDVAGDKKRAAELAPKYGLGLTVPGEDWHFELTFGRNGKDVGAGDIIGGAIDALPGPNPLDAAGAAAAFIGLLFQARTWWRVLGVVGGTVILVAGVSVIATDLGAARLVPGARALAKPRGADVGNPTPSPGFHPSGIKQGAPA